MTDRRFILVSVQTLVLFAGFQSAMYFLSFLLIQSFNYSALEAGIASLPISIIVALISARAGRYASLYGPRNILFLSSLLMASGLLWLSFSTGDYFRSVFPGIMLIGLSVGLFAAPLTTVAMSAAGPGRDGLASGVSNAASRIGPLLGVAIFSYWIGGDYARGLINALETSGFTADQQAYLIDNRTMMAAISLPVDWPETTRLAATQMVQDLFAYSVQDVLRFGAIFALLSAILALLYKKTDTR